MSMVEQCFISSPCSVWVRQDFEAQNDDLCSK